MEASRRPVRGHAPRSSLERRLSAACDLVLPPSPHLVEDEGLTPWPVSAKLLGMKLNANQLSGLRYYDPEDEYVTNPPLSRTTKSLDEKGLIRWDHARKSFILSRWGKQYIRDYVAQSGNGPEDLKARFSFLGGR